MADKALIKATLLLPCSVVIVSARAGDRQGAMTATAMYVSQEPPLLAVSISKTDATYQLIEQSKEFAINVIADSQTEISKKLGSEHGHEVDKLRKFGIATEEASTINVPLLEGCYAHFECRVKSGIWEVEGNHAIYFAEVTAFKVNKKLNATIWLNGRYFQVGDVCRI
jgi:flavin reductase (DIM6/NTAB) family NADH-FMN oxidoreductase RutF